MDDIPAFLRRTPFMPTPINPKGNEMTHANAAEPKTRTKRQSAYIANIKAVAPLKDAAGLVEAMKAVEAANVSLAAAGFTVTIAADTGRV